MFNTTRTVVALAFAAAVAALAAVPAHAQSVSAREHIPVTKQRVLNPVTPPSHDVIDNGRALVKPVAGADFARIRRDQHLTLEKASLFGWYVVTFDSQDRETTDAKIENLRKDARIAAADAVVHHQSFRTPNDEGFQYTWGLHDIGMETVWSSTFGLSDQRVGLVDSGIVAHNDLSPADYGGWDFISNGNAAADGNGRDQDYTDDGPDGEFHGSHVGGTMVASGNNGIGIPGINWEARLVTVRALSNNDGDIVDIAEGAAWLAGFSVEGVPDIGVDHVSVINLSLGSLGPCTTFEQEVYTAIQNTGVSVVAATGNDPTQATSDPANCPGVVAVSAMGPTYELAQYASFDSRVTVVAPGGDSSAGYDLYGDILSIDGATSDGYKFMEGTSMASPHVAGVVSLMQAMNPTLSPAQISAILMTSPYTCTGCNDQSSLAADDAIAKAASLTGELPSVPGTGTLAPGASTSTQPPADTTGGPNTQPDPTTDPTTPTDPTQPTTPPPADPGNVPTFDNGTGTPTCPANSHLVSGSLQCSCNSGFVVNASGLGCILPQNTIDPTDPNPDPNPNPGPSDPVDCPVNSTVDADGETCVCNLGFHHESTGCVQTTNDPPPANPPPQNFDPPSETHRRTGPAPTGGCSSSGAAASPLGLAVVGLALLRRRRR